MRRPEDLSTAMAALAVLLLIVLFCFLSVFA